MSWRRTASACALVAAFACSGPEEWRHDTATTRSSGALPPALIPATQGPFAPALTQLQSGVSVRGSELVDDARCAACHQAIADQWRRSAHAFASFNNPFYRVSVDQLRRERSREASLACAGCHDPALLVDGAMTQAVEPQDERAHAGIGCSLCHRTTHASAAGNGSYVLGPVLALPRSGTPAERDRHLASVRRAPLKSAELCGACHRAFLGPASGNAHFLSGADDYGPWARSRYAGSLGQRIAADTEPQGCRDCHMPAVRTTLPDAAARDGRVASHLFAGGHTHLAKMRGDREALIAAQRLLQGSIALDVVALTQGERTTWLPLAQVEVSSADALTIDVVLTNEHVGHHFPGGVRDAQQTIVQALLRDSQGSVLATGPGHSLAAGIVDRRGRLVQGHATHQFASVAFDHTIAPGESRLVRFAVSLPALQLAPRAVLFLEVVVSHRSRDTQLSRSVCADSKKQRGREFLRASRGRGVALDPCVAAPVTVIARQRISLSSASSAQHELPAWRRMLRYGRALLGDVSERVGAAEPVLRAALAAAPAEPFAQAQLHAELARLAERQGRLRAAEEHLTAAAGYRPRHPALVRRAALSRLRVWDFGAATPLLAQAAAGAPRDDRLWARWATALASQGHPRAAYRAARSALVGAPRSEALLRVQALSLRQLGAADADAALAAYGAHRAPDSTQRLNRECERYSEYCAKERLAVHTHVLSP